MGKLHHGGYWGEVQQRLAPYPAAAAVFVEKGGAKFVYNHVKQHDLEATYRDALGWHQRVLTPHGPKTSTGSRSTHSGGSSASTSTSRCPGRALT